LEERSLVGKEGTGRQLIKKSLVLFAVVVRDLRFPRVMVMVMMGRSEEFQLIQPRPPNDTLLEIQLVIRRKQGTSGQRPRQDDLTHFHYTNCRIQVLRAVGSIILGTFTLANIAS